MIYGPNAVGRFRYFFDSFIVDIGDNFNSVQTCFCALHPKYDTLLLNETVTSST